jgi:UDP-N-acetylmuramoyl-L-alanyl-D-glutamate--2,6-diaminopimelate ligase
MDPNSSTKSIMLDGARLQLSGVHFDSRKIKNGDLFVAVPGMEADGHHYIHEAIKAGAACVVGENDLTDLPVPYCRVSNARAALAQIAGQFYDNPSKRHTMIGITGTNGKTTTAHLLQHIAQRSGITCSLIGTVSNRINGVEIPSAQTTPDALQLQQWLNESRDQTVIMEVSSHGIAQERVGAIEFDYALFTNLTHDHLDYHKTMESYFQTKARLFDQIKYHGQAIISSGCQWGNRLIEKLLRQQRDVRTFGETERDDLRILRVYKEAALQFEVQDGDTQYEVKLPLPGMYNARNAAAAWLTARLMGIAPAVIQDALRNFPGVPGRFEVYPHPRGAQFVVDYAHTPDGFQQFLRTLHLNKPKRMIHIFGFRGRGDRSKRRLMLEISAAWCDLIILTLDNLQGVPIESMTAELRELAKQLGRDLAVVIEDRTKAIQYAWNRVSQGDFVAITGKGRETYEHTFALPCRTDQETIEYLSF